MRISDWSSDVCSSDLGEALLRRGGGAVRIVDLGSGTGANFRFLAPRLAALGASAQSWRLVDRDENLLERVAPIRSEEHTSELQSLMRISYAVFCLKKKNHNIHKRHYPNPNSHIAIRQTPQ